MRAGHHQRGRDALVGHVADSDADPPAGHLDEVVEVATDRAGRTVVRGDLPLRQVRQLARQELLLDQGRDAHLLLEPLALGGLVRLLADELRDADRRRGLRGEGRQQAAVVGRVVLLGQPRAEVERADQLALGDERHHERHARLAHRAERRRVQLEPGDLDRAGRGLEVGEQRVRLGDVDGDRGPVVRGRRRAGRHGLDGDLVRLRGAGGVALASQEAADRAGQLGHVGVTVVGVSSGNRYGRAVCGRIRCAGAKILKSMDEASVRRRRARPPRRARGRCRRAAGPSAPRRSIEAS